MNRQDESEQSFRAAEYVLGLLSEEEHQEVVKALESDVDLSRQVAFWQDRLLALTSSLTPLEPSETLWARIDAALGPQAAIGTESVQVDRTRSMRWKLPNLWGELVFWRAISAVAVAIAIATSATLMFRTPEIRVYYAVLNSPDDRPGWLVQARQNGSFRLIPLASMATVPDDKSWELWTKADGATGPTSLGSVTAGQEIEFSADQLPTLGNNQLFEITVEPPEGSPIGRPTGPVIFIGKTKPI